MRVVKETDVKKINSFVIKVDMEHAGMETVKLLFDFKIKVFQKFLRPSCRATA